MLKFYYVGDYIRNVNGGLKGPQFRNLVMVGFLNEPPLKSPSSDKVLTSFKRGAIYLLESAHKS